MKNTIICGEILFIAVMKYLQSYLMIFGASFEYLNFIAGNFHFGTLDLIFWQEEFHPCKFDIKRSAPVVSSISKGYPPELESISLWPLTSILYDLLPSLKYLIGSVDQLLLYGRKTVISFDDIIA